jgi:catechol-2,3-dioxygenase
VTILHHVALGAKDVSRVAGFYREVLRLPQVTEHHHDDGSLRSIWLSLGLGLLMVERTSEERRHVHGVDAGAFLIAFTWPEGLEHAADWLASHQVATEDRSEFSLYFRDPEGNRAAISVYPLPE